MLSLVKNATWAYSIPVFCSTVRRPFVFQVKESPQHADAIKTLRGIELELTRHRTKAKLYNAVKIILR